MATKKKKKKKTAKQTKLRRFELRWAEHKKYGEGWMLFLNGRAYWTWDLLGYHNKRKAIENARLDASWDQDTKPSQLYICNKKGRYQTEHTYPRSRDPRRSRG